MVSFSFAVQGWDKLKAGLSNVEHNYPQATEQAMRAATLKVAATAKRDYLSGPRPDKLGVVTGRLRNSIMTQVRGSGGTVQGIVGTSIIYAAIHEYGGTILPVSSDYLRFFFEKAGHWVSLKQVTIPARPFLSTALRDERPYIERLFMGPIFQLLKAD